MQIKMFPYLLITFAMISPIFSETTFTLVRKGTKIGNNGNGSYAVGYASADEFVIIPPDNGSNWGDYIWKTRVYLDSLLIREIQVNTVSSEQQQYNWNANFPNKNITHIRFLNVGRERAFVQSICSEGAVASANVVVAPNLQFRLLIEVYAL